MNETLDIAPLLRIEDYKEKWDAPDDDLEESESGNDDGIDRLTGRVSGAA